jgi:uncharacterized protein YegP (UPF0339 family)
MGNTILTSVFLQLVHGKHTSHFSIALKYISKEIILTTEGFKKKKSVALQL